MSITEPVFTLRLHTAIISQWCSFQEWSSGLETSWGSVCSIVNSILHLVLFWYPCPDRSIGKCLRNLALL